MRRLCLPESYDPFISHISVLNATELVALLISSRDGYFDFKRVVEDPECLLLDNLNNVNDGNFDLETWFYL